MRARVSMRSKPKGVVTCGLGDNVAGFSQHEAGKNWSGFDVDLCRAIAAAILGDPAKAAFRPIDVLPRFLQSNDIDVVLRGLTWTFGREARSDVRFGPIVFYDGQTFLVPKSANIQTRRAAVGKADLRLDRRRVHDAASGLFPRAQSHAAHARDRAPSGSRRRVLRRPVRCDGGRCVRARGSDHRQSSAAGRFHDPAAADHQGTAGAVHAQRRCAVLRRRALDDLRADQRRGARHHAGQCRSDADERQPRDPPLLRSPARGRRASCAAGPTTSSKPSAITARSTTAISARGAAPSSPAA